MIQVLMTQGEELADEATKHLIFPYRIELDFCPNNGLSTLRRLQNCHYDAVILRQGLPDLTLNAIKRQFESSIPSPSLLPQPRTLFFALLSQPDTALSESLSNCGFSGIISYPYSEYKLAMLVLDHTSEKMMEYYSAEEKLRLEIREMLLTIGCPSHLKGFYYLCECLIYLAKNPASLYMATKVLYPEVALKMNTSGTNLERSMRTALEHIWKVGDPNLISAYFPNYYARKICVTQFLATLTQRIQMRHQSESKTAL